MHGVDGLRRRHRQVLIQQVFPWRRGRAATPLLFGEAGMRPRP